MQDNQFTYLLESWKASIGYFINHADRAWTRFNILLTVELLLAGLVGSAWANVRSASSTGILLTSLLGLIVSLLMYTQSAQDKYMLAEHLIRINEIRKKIEQGIGRDDIPALFTPLDDIDLGKGKFIFKEITCWRSSHFGLTSIPSLASLLFIAFWIIAIITKIMGLF